MCQDYQNILVCLFFSLQVLRACMHASMRAYVDHATEAVCLYSKGGLYNRW